MCGSTTHLGKGTRCAPPLHPSGHGEGWVLNPTIATKTYRRFTTRRAWRFPSPPAPNHGSKGVSPPLETHSWKTSLSLHPSIKERSCPCEILTIPWRPTLRGLDAASASTLNPNIGLSRPCNPTRRSRRFAASTCTQPCMNDCPFNHQTGFPSSARLCVNAYRQVRRNRCGKPEKLSPVPGFNSLWLRKYKNRREQNDRIFTTGLAEPVSRGRKD